MVVDSDLREPLAFFEVKSKRLNRDNMGKYLAQVQSYAEIDAKGNVPAYLVTPDEKGSGLSFYRFTLEDRSEEDSDDEEQKVLKVSAFVEVSSDRLPSYDALLARSPRASVKNSVEKTRDTLQLLCLVMAGILICLLVIDFVLFQHKIEVVTSNRLAILGATIGLVLLPFAQRLSLLGFEYERLQSAPSTPKSARRPLGVGSRPSNNTFDR
jgi:hypothetical protein